VTDCRGLQRALFRMQLDAAFARAVFARDAAALASLELAPDDLALLLEADPAGVSADRHGRRLGQLLGNVGSEFARGVWALETRAGRASFLTDFASSDELHAALRTDRPLPLAFADYALARAGDGVDPLARSLLELDVALARARREPAERPRPRPTGDAVALAPWVRLVRVVPGALDVAAELGAALEAGEAPREGLVPAAGGAQRTERVLVQAREHAPERGLREVRAEVLQPAVAALLEAAADAPLAAGDRARLARAWEAEPSALEAFAAALVEDAVLVRGGPPGRARARPPGAATRSRRPPT